MSAAIEEDLDLSDLDLLDDEQRHARCTVCFPYGSIPFVALCGTRAIALTDCPADEVPVNACGECEHLWGRPCRRCGL